MEMRTPSAFRREAGFEKNRMHQADQIAVHELRRRQVDRDLQRDRPRSGLPAGFAQDPFTHLDDQAAFFRERDEIARRNEAAHRMQPPRQGLEADDFTGGDGVARHRLRLVMQRQFAVLDRDREILVQHAAIANLLVHLGFIDADRAARFGLGAEQCRAGIGKQRCGVGTVVREYRDAGGDTGANRFAVDLELVRQRFGELFGQQHPGDGLLAVDDQSEFVA
jgi:hypothetical protein